MKSLFLISAFSLTALSQIQLPFNAGDQVQPLTAPEPVQVRYLVEDPLGNGWFVK